MKIVAAGICPQGLSPGARAPNTSESTVINGGTGIWQITTYDPTLVPGNCILLLSPGSGSNLPKGISFGQSQQVGNVFTFGVYRNDTGAFVDLEVQFSIMKLVP